MRFWDSSAVVPLIIEQAPSSACSRALDDDPELWVWWGTIVECESAIGRAERTRRITADSAETARSSLGVLAAAWQEVQPSQLLRHTAQRLLRVHPLRTGDALQAAAAIVAADSDPSAFTVVCLDSRLAEALRREGFAVEAPA